MRILVCDDEPARGEEAVAEVRASGCDGEVEMLAGQALTDELDALVKRADAAVLDPNTYAPGEDLRFDGADLVLFDNNLAHLDIRGVRLTAEAVVGYVRAFTRAGYLVSLNKNPDVDFDLRYLVGDYETRADLSLNTDHLRNRALWSGAVQHAEQEFLPWYWPRLEGAAARRRAQVAFVRERLPESVFASLKIPTTADALDFLSLHAKSALYPNAVFDGGAVADNGKAFEEVTFLDVFVAKSRSLPGQDERVKLLAAAAGESPNDVVVDCIARVVAADVDLWFRRDMVAPQEMLVDLPHLLLRMPFLLGSGAAEIGGWNEALDADAAPYGLDASLFSAHLAPAAFVDAVWAPRPSFWWPKLKADGQLADLFFVERDVVWEDAAFCEDRSRFLPRVPPPPAPPPVEFTAEFEGAWRRRHVEKLAGLRYSPLVRFTT